MISPGVVQSIFSGASLKFQTKFEARVSNDCGERIGTLRSDNGGEYLSKEFRSYLKSRGIIATPRADRALLTSAKWFHREDEQNPPGDSSINDGSHWFIIEVLRL